MTNGEYWFGNNTNNHVTKRVAILFAKWLRENYYINSSNYFELKFKQAWIKQGDSKFLFVSEEELFDLWCQEEYKE